MKLTKDIKEEVFRQLEISGFMKNKQAQIKSYVFELVQKLSSTNQQKIGFQYEHPLLSKLRKYPLTSLCLDLIQEFLESFKFKHTLNVFKKQINRNLTINRNSLSQQFKIEIKNPDSQAILLSLVSQMVSGDVGSIRNNFKPTEPIKQVTKRQNNFMTNESKNNSNSQKNQSSQPIPPNFNKIQETSFSGNSNSKSVISNSNNDSKSNISKTQPQIDSKINESSNINISSEPVSNNQSIQTEKDKGDKKNKKKGGKIEKQIEKPPEGAKDLLDNVMKKFGNIKTLDKEEEKKQIFESKRAFSEEKEKKKVDDKQSGANVIRGLSAGKTMSSFMKFMPQPPPQKNQSYIDEELDEFQQSKDSTRKNPLFSSSQSGFDKSGFDQSVDSNAIENYEYVQKAKRFTKKY